MASRKRAYVAPAPTENDDDDDRNGSGATAASKEKVAFGEKGGYDQDVYGSVRGGNRAAYVTSINAGDDDDDDDDDNEADVLRPKQTVYSAPKKFIEEAAKTGEVSASLSMLQCLYVAFQEIDPFAETRIPTIAERQNSYQSRGRNRQISPERSDPFLDGKCTLVPNQFMLI